MNHEWNINFLQNTSCVQKVSSHELYLPRGKWTTNETLIFYKIRVVFKKNRAMICIYKEGNEPQMKH